MHKTIEPTILYFGTPVALISSINPDSSANLAPMSSVWWLGWSAMLGLGTMGAAMAANLARAGFAVTAWNRTAGRAPELADLGVEIASSPAQAVADTPIVVICVSDTPDVEAVLFGDREGLHLIAADKTASASQRLRALGTLSHVTDEDLRPAFEQVFIDSDYHTGCLSCYFAYANLKNEAKWKDLFLTVWLLGRAKPDYN